MELDRDHKLKALRRRLNEMRDTAMALHGEPWWRSHHAICASRSLRNPGEAGRVVSIALADAQEVKRGHGGYGTDPANESATSRHILSTCPQKIVAALKLLDELFPELVEKE